jgi:hypothetical protein
LDYLGIYTSFEVAALPCRLAFHQAAYRFQQVADFRLHPVHPFLHLLPAAEPQLIEEPDRRFGWKERNSRKLKELPGIESK